ncbi:hypothetical protein B0T21DRAFT_414017 [Apiosordaria backusii]|uniref:RRM domain-containing protein n=1 Tax=Apiosordaria backusii TaxID=314023 RepID=A0AA40AX47_9PEZI|nr:hypothetical protein B0T21DRAFT_414017 [Apiosordaria backusii]
MESNDDFVPPFQGVELLAYLRASRQRNSCFPALVGPSRRRTQLQHSQAFLGQQSSTVAAVQNRPDSTSQPSAVPSHHDDAARFDQAALESPTIMNYAPPALVSPPGPSAQFCNINSLSRGVQEVPSITGYGRESRLENTYGSLGTYSGCSTHRAQPENSPMMAQSAQFLPSTDGQMILDHLSPYVNGEMILSQVLPHADGEMILNQLPHYFNGEMILNQHPPYHDNQMILNQSLPFVGDTEMPNQVLSHVGNQQISSQLLPYAGSQQMSENYKGRRDILANHSADIPDIHNTSLWITGLPADVTVHQLLKTISGFGRVLAVYINEPDKDNGHALAAAKLTFFEQDAAQRFLFRYRVHGLSVGNLLATVRFNRVRVEEKSYPENASRVIVVIGSRKVAKEDWIREQLTSRGIYYDTDEIIENVNPITGWVRLEWRFGSYRGQASQAYRVLRGAEGRKHGLVIAFGPDPCA